MQVENQSFFKGVAVQLTAVLLASLGAVLISSAQALTSGAIPCEPVVADPAQAGLLGGLLKGLHSALSLSHGTMRS